MPEQGDDGIEKINNHGIVNRLAEAVVDMVKAAINILIAAP